MRNAERKQKLLNKQNQNIARLKQAAAQAATQAAANLETEKAEVAKIKAELNGSKTLSEQQRKNLENKLKIEQNQVQTAQTNLKAALENRSRVERQLKEAEERLTEERATKNTKIQLLEANESLARQAAQAAQAELTKKQEEFQQKENELRAQAAQANEIRNQMQEQRNAIQKNKELSNAEKNAALAKLRENMEKQQKAQKKIIEKTQKLSNKRQATITKLKNNLQTATNNLTNTKQSLIKTEGWLKTKTNKLARAEGLITTQKASINASKKNLKAKQKQVGNLYRNIKAKNAALAQKNKEAAAALAQKNREAAEALARRNADVQTMTQTIAAKNVQLQEALTRVRNANDRHETNRAAFAALEAESANLQQDLTAAQELFKQAASERATSRWKRAIGNAASSKKINKLKNNTKALGKEIQNGKRTLTATQRTLNQTKETLAFEQNQVGRLAQAEQKVRGQLKNTRGQLQTTQGELQTTQGQLQTTQGQLQTTQGQLQAAQSAATLNQRRTQAQLNQARKSAKNFKAAARAPTVNTFNSTAAFQKMGNNLNQAERDKLIRKLEVKIDITSDNGSKYVINDPIPGPFGRLPGAERRALKKEIRTASLERLKEINLMINKRKKEINNFKIDVNTNKAKPATPKQRFGTDNQVKQAMKQTRVNTTQGVNQGKSSMAQMVSKGNAKSQINKLQKIGGKTKIAYKKEVNRGANPQNVVKRAKAANSKAKMGRTLQALRAGNAKKDRPNLQRSTSSIGGRVANRHQRQRQRQQ